MSKTIPKISFSCRLVVIALMSVEESDNTRRFLISFDVAAMIADLTARASATRGEATDSCNSVPCCMVFPSFPVQIQASPALLVVLSHDASVLQVIVSGGSGRYLGDSCLCRVVCPGNMEFCFGSFA